MAWCTSRAVVAVSRSLQQFARQVVILLFVSSISFHFSCPSQFFTRIQACVLSIVANPYEPSTPPTPLFLVLNNLLLGSQAWNKDLKHAS